MVGFLQSRQLDLIRPTGQVLGLAAFCSVIESVVLGFASLKSLRSICRLRKIGNEKQLSTF